MKAYVGITGPVTVEETRSVCDEFYNANYSMYGSHIPMLGFLVSYKTLSGRETQNRRYPPINLVPDLLKATNNRVLTMIHYNSNEIDTLSNQVNQIFDGIYESDLCKALQLNIVWPDIKEVAKIKEQYPDMKIVFQASNKVIQNTTPRELAKGVKKYGDLLSYVLIDPSGGRGKSFDLESSLAIYSQLREQCNVTIGFAGGFTGENVYFMSKHIAQNINSYEFCIDSEGGLRDKITFAYGDDLLNINKVRAYLQESSLAFK